MMRIFHTWVRAYGHGFRSSGWGFLMHSACRKSDPRILFHMIGYSGIINPHSGKICRNYVLKPGIMKDTNGMPAAKADGISNHYVCKSPFPNLKASDKELELGADNELKRSLGFLSFCCADNAVEGAQQQVIGDSQVLCPLIVRKLELEYLPGT